MAANFLNRLKWTRALPESKVVILHRGGPMDKKTIYGNRITEIKKDHFSYLDEENKRETYIPMHRVLEIWMNKDHLVWKKRARAAAPKPKARPKTSRKVAGLPSAPVPPPPGKGRTGKQSKKPKTSKGTRKSKKGNSRMPAAGKLRKAKTVKKKPVRKSRKSKSRR